MTVTISLISERLSRKVAKLDQYDIEAAIKEYLAVHHTTHKMRPDAAWGWAEAEWEDDENTGRVSVSIALVRREKEDEGATP